MVTIYGIKNCDTVKKARQWLDSHAIDYRFHDFRADGLQAKQVSQWIKRLGLEQLINKRSTTWKQLAPATRDSLDDKSALQVILDNPTLIKRPLLETKEAIQVGFKADNYAQLLN